jgi:hypothetical protein
MKASGQSKEQVIENIEIVEKLIEEREWNLTPDNLEERAKNPKGWLDEDEGRIWTPEEIEELIKDFARMAA